MYDIDNLSGRWTFDPGTSLLVTGETHRAHDITIDLLADRPPGEGAVLISTNGTADQVVQAFDERGTDLANLGVVDCAGDESHTAPDSPARMSHVASPGDLTGISLEFAKLVQGMGGEIDGLRVGFSSVSTVLMYADVETTFRFLHVFTSRISSGGWLGVFTIDQGMHDAEVVSTIRAVFDAEARVGEDGIDLQGRGFS